jgi:hypothetical protein
MSDKTYKRDGRRTGRNRSEQQREPVYTLIFTFDGESKRIVIPRSLLTEIIDILREKQIEQIVLKPMHEAKSRSQVESSSAE